MAMKINLIVVVGVTCHNVLFTLIVFIHKVSLSVI